MFVGHEYLVKDFKNLARSGRLAHGYIFFGEPETGKFYFARHLANFLENFNKSNTTNKTDKSDKSDSSDRSDNEFKISSRPLQDALILEDATGIEDMRQIKNFLWQKPVISSRRLVIINDAQNLTQQAQNAILKITEEPPDRATIILVTNQLENLLPTLLSRLQKIHFSRLSDSEMEKVISPISRIGRISPISPSGPIIGAALGRPGRAMRLKENQLTKDADNYAIKFLASSAFNRSKLIKELVDLQRDLTDKEDKESMLMDYFFESLILKLREDPIKNNKLLKSALHRLFLIKSYNVNKRLQLEALS
ncbi:MAG: AAA family ATPase [Candidatus Harrisonbacteria bacterium]|nr:AAA family ATPase [Candidatus Harrisonbacteria bacterium]